MNIGGAHSPSFPFPSSLPSPPPSLPSPLLPLDVGPLNPARGSGGAGLFLVCSSTQSAVLNKFVQFYSLKCAVAILEAKFLA